MHDYPYNGFYPGDPPPGNRALKWAVGAVAAALLVFALTACSPAPVEPVTKADPSCYTPAQAIAKMAEPDSDFKDAEHRHLKGVEARRFVAKVFSVDVPATFTDLLIYDDGSGQWRLVFFDNGCAFMVEDIPAPGKKPDPAA